MLNITQVQTSALANAAAPTHLEGSFHPLSMDLSGNLRVTQPGYNTMVNALSTTALLNAGLTWDSGWVDVLQYGHISTMVYANVDSAAAGVVFYWSANGADVDQQSSGDTFIHAAVDGAVFFSTPVRNHYFRLTYTNGAVNQARFVVHTIAAKNAQSGDIIPADYPPLLKSAAASLVKAIITGRQPPSEGGAYTDVLVNKHGALQVTEANTHGAFGGLLTAVETPVVTMKFPLGLQAREQITTTASGGTVTSANSLALLTTGVNVAGSAQLESRDGVRYIPGAGILIRFSCRYTAGAVSSQQEVGYGDANDGLFFGYVGNTFGIIRRSGGVDTFTAQSAWNGDDRFDGSGPAGTNPSGATLDPTKLNVFQIQMQWLGAGYLRFYIEDPTTGDFTLVHSIKYPNTATVPHMGNPNLPLHARAWNSGNNSSLVTYIGSMGASIEGLNTSVSEDIRNSFHALGTTIPTTGQTVFSLKNKATNVFGAANVNHIVVKLTQVSIRSNSGGAGQDIYVTLFLNATIGGAPAFTDLTTATSVIQTDVAGTGTGTGGIPLMTFCCAASDSVTTNLVDFNLLLRPGDTLSAVAFSEAGTPTCRVALGWVEQN